MKLNTVRLGIFSLTLEQGVNDSPAVKDALQNAIPCINVYLQGKAYIMNNCFYYFEPSENGNTKLHIVAGAKKYRDEKALQKRDSLIAALRGPQRFNIKSGKIEALWPQWQKVPGHILAKYLCRKNNKCYA